MDHDFPIPSDQENICSIRHRVTHVNYRRFVKNLQTNEHLCRLGGYKPTMSFNFLLSKEFGYYPALSLNISMQSIIKLNQSTQITSLIDEKLQVDCDREFELYCFRGILVLYGSNKTKQCLCPPNYFGSRCQWQNQQQPKLLSNNYSIRIDLYEKKTLDYWGSWHLSIPFLFLPVNRIATQLQISEVSDNQPCILSCGQHGKSFETIPHERTILLKKIPFDQTNIIVYAPVPFNILSVQIPNHEHYLVVLRETYLPSENISTEVQLKDRYFHIKELFNSIFLQYEPLRQIKSYPLLCQQYSQLKCFCDDNDLMCICDVNRFSNCFAFNYTEKNDCQGNHFCKNDGQCFQNRKLCPSKLSCICQDCYYGERCQYSTSSYMFSLDPILGYHIQLNVSIIRQPLIIQISIIINTIIFIIRLINGSLSIITFGRNNPRQVGTKNYLLISSISSILMIIIFTYKFWFFVLSQISTINNRIILQIHCIILDFILKVLLVTRECVKQNTSFDKKKSKELSKWIIICVIILIILTYIHDPLHRELVDDIDIDQPRIWCLVQYLPSMNIYNSFITLFHFLIPFIINVFSAIWLILSLARSRAGVQRDQPYKQHLRHQLDQHRHLLISPCLLILLNLPRLIISFISGCMRSARQPWLQLIGYFLSFIPSMLTFIVFILPSKNYSGEFHAAVQEINKKCRAFFSRS
ncbi:hypothetical protein I4U23_022024 [Adineta vaga]|nr:hypothetical protein I4U23_022024 [Adineta vaga]